MGQKLHRCLHCKKNNSCCKRDLSRGLLCSRCRLYKLRCSVNYFSLVNPNNPSHHPSSAKLTHLDRLVRPQEETPDTNTWSGAVVDSQSLVQKSKPLHGGFPTQQHTESAFASTEISNTNDMSLSSIGEAESQLSATEVTANLLPFKVATLSPSTSILIPQKSPTQPSQQDATKSPRVSVKFKNDLSSTELHWTEYEIGNNRRIVEYSFFQEKEGGVVQINFESVDPRNRKPKDFSMSCIRSLTGNDCFVTSFDIYRLLEYFTGYKLAREDKCYLRQIFSQGEYQRTRCTSEMWKIISGSNLRSVSRNGYLYPWKKLKSLVEGIIGECVRNPVIDG